MKIDTEKAELFELVRTALGAPIRSVELLDDQLCNLLTLCTQDYSKEVYNWLIENQWMSLYGKQISNIDMAFALTVRTMDMMKDYSYWFSKEVGLQQRGPWELKKDWVGIEYGKQNYLIPAGREINKVLYCTPSTTNAALYAQAGGMIGFGGGGMGMAQIGGAGYGGGMAGFYISPAYDTLLLASDLNLKNRILRSDLTYKVTAGPNGTKILHLLSTPGSKFTFGTSGISNGMVGLVGCQVWYTYYDVNPGEEDDCRLENPDVLITPDQVPVGKMEYALMNDPTKTLIRQLLIAKAKELLGLIRGKFSGVNKIPDAESQLDYQMLLQQGKDEYDKTMLELKERLIRMNPINMMKNQAELVQAMLEIKKGTPLGVYVI